VGGGGEEAALTRRVVDWRDAVCRKVHGVALRQHPLAAGLVVWLLTKF
jgi:hypothetical protein